MSLLKPVPPSSTVLDAFITRHEYLLQLERDAEEEQTRLLNSNCSPKLLEQRGLALNGLGVSGITVGLGGKSLVELVRPLAYHTSQTLPPHTFRNGDPVRIEPNVTVNIKGKGKKKADEDEGAVEGVIYRVSAEKVIIAVDESKEIDLPERLRLLKLANSVTFDRMGRTLAHLRRIVVPYDSAGQVPPNVPNVTMINCLLGLEEPQWLDEVPATFAQSEAEGSTGGVNNEIQWFGGALNESQQEAIAFCLKAETVACIHGPPGTGKTHTLIELIFQLLSRPVSATENRPPRILITTPSNLALDNLLLRLHTLAQLPPYSAILPPGSVLRLGHPTRVHRDLVGQTLDYRAKNGDEGALLKDVGKELEGHLSDLAKKRGEKGAIKGKERGVKWQEVRDLRKEHRQREGKVVGTVVKAAQVVLATCHSAGSRQINNMQFDVCIVDEATQAVEAVCWVPILKSKKLILAGDPQQLPPTIISKEKPTKISSSAGDSTGADAEVDLSSLDIKNRTRLTPPRTLETTLFDRLEKLYGDGIKRVLKIQYRMNETIASFPSDTLYDSSLVSDPSVAKRTLLELPTIVDPMSEDTVDALQPTVVFFDTDGCEFYERTEGDGETTRAALGEGSKSNENEAVVVCKWAKKLVSPPSWSLDVSADWLIAMGVPENEVAVVTPYQAQVSLISEMIHEEHPTMTIGSVDGLQGQEREAIILSLVRSNTNGEVGFLGEYRRLNVAMTRAKRQLCVVGDSSTVGQGSKYLKSWMEWLEANADVRYAGEEII